MRRSAALVPKVDGQTKRGCSLNLHAYSAKQVSGQIRKGSASARFVLQENGRMRLAGIIYQLAAPVLKGSFRAKRECRLNPPAERVMPEDGRMKPGSVNASFVLQANG